MNFIVGIILFIILGIVVVVITMPIWLILFSIFFRINNKTDFQRKIHYNIIFTFIIGLLLLVAITPVSESISCDETFSCRLETEYLIPFIKRSEKILLNKNSYLGVIKREHYNSNRHGGHGIKSVEYYLVLYNSSRKSPKLFRYNSGYINTISSYVPQNLKDYGTYDLKNDVESFQNYKNNPQNSFYAQSSLTSWRLCGRLFNWTMLIIIIMILNLTGDRKEVLNDIFNNIKSIIGIK